MEKLYKQGENIKEAVKVGDVIEIKSGIFIKVKSIETITEEDLAGTKKTNVYIKGEILSNGKG
jgi:preprotein translocase subunit YajC